METNETSETKETVEGEARTMICNVCKCEQTVMNFAPSHRSYKSSRCRACINHIANQRYKFDPKLKSYHKKYYSENAEHLKEGVRAYKKNNRDKVKKWKKKYGEKPEQRIRKAQARRVKSALERADSAKKMSTLKYLGCTAKELKQHLENQFKEGMTWDNYGIDGWHIDHIRPLCSYDLTIEEDQLEAFHYTNLQPLWAEENISKGGFWQDQDI